jgi:hypothetical protein
MNPAMRATPDERGRQRHDGEGTLVGVRIAFTMNDQVRRTDGPCLTARHRRR